MDKRGSQPLEAALSQPQQRRDSKKAWAPGLLCSIQRPPAWSVEGSAQAEGDGAGEYSQTVGTDEAQVFFCTFFTFLTPDSFHEKSAYVRKEMNAK